MIVQMSMPEGRRFICGELAQFAAFRRDGLTSDEAAAAMHVGPDTGDLYEDTLRQLLQLAANTIDPRPGLEVIRARTQKDETAPAATDAAPTPRRDHS